MENNREIIRQCVSKFSALNSSLSLDVVNVQKAIDNNVHIGWLNVALHWLAAKTLRKKGAYSVLTYCLFILAGLAISSPGIWEYVITIFWGDNQYGQYAVHALQLYDDTVDHFVVGCITLIAVVIASFKGLEEWDKHRVRKELKMLISAITFQPSDDWFDQKCKLAITTIGERYSPKENFRNPKLSNIYRALISPDYWSKDFKNALKSYLTQAHKDFDGLKSEYKESHAIIKSNIDTIVEIYNNKVCNRFGEIFSLAEDIFLAFQELYYQYNNAYYGYSYERLSSLRQNLYDFKALCQYIHKPVIYVKGVAGTGKSHLLADIVTERMSMGHKSILLLGLEFTDSKDIREQIMTKLSAKGTWDDFLSKVNTIARIENDKIIIFIDGVNEGVGEKLWKDQLKGLEEEVLQYDHLGLVISARTFANSNMLDAASKDSATIVLDGFRGMEDQALSYLTGKFGIAIPNISHHLRDFANPLFLRLYCKSYDKALPQPNSFLDIVSNYLSVCNRKISIKYNYEPAMFNYVALAADVLTDMYVKEAGRKNKFQILSAYITELNSRLPKSIDASRFVQDLVSEGVLMCYSNYEGTILVDFNFDLVGDYQCANALLLANWQNYYGSVRDAGIYEATAVLLPLVKGVEIYDYNVTNIGLRHRQDLFLQSLRQRFILSNSTLLTLEGIRVNEPDKFYEYAPDMASFEECGALFDRFNANLKSMPLQVRDSQYAMYYTLRCGGIDYTKLTKLAKWAVSISRKSALRLSDSQSFQISSVLCWSFCIPYNPLRFLATKAAVNLLRDKDNVLVKLIELLDDVNDPYIQQRLYAVVHGCVFKGVCANSRIVAETIYQKVFDVDVVRPDILLRDYAHCAIDRVLQHVEANVDVEKITPPYQTTFAIESCPSREYIEEHYRLKVDNVYTQDEVNAQNRILSSMETEYSNGTGGYGDFGRYVFESHIDAWERDIPGFAPSVRNYAVDLIFRKYGYDPKVYAVHDSHYERSRGDNTSIERFGKKYQWISMFEVMALLSDNYKMDSDVSNHKNIEYQGAWNPHVRDIDTTNSYYHIGEELPIREEKLDWTVNNSMPFEIKEPDRWLSNEEGISKDSIIQTIEVVDDQNEEWVVIHGYNRLTKHTDDIILNDGDNGLWVFAQAYVCPQETKEILVKDIYKHGTQGRRAPEYSNSFYTLYYKDYYSSASYRDYAHLTDLENWETYEDGNAKFQIAYYPYAAEGENSIYRLNHLLFKILNLMDGERDGEYVDANGRVVAFDPSVNNSNEGQLLVRKAELINALKENNLQIVWPILCEKQRGVGMVGNQIGGVAYYDRKFGLKVKLRMYVDKPIDYKKKAKKEKLKNQFKMGWYLATLQKSKFQTLKEQQAFYELCAKEGLDAFRRF